MQSPVSVAVLLAVLATTLLLIVSSKPQHDVILQSKESSDPDFVDLGAGQVGWGPVYYADTNLYGGSTARDFARQPYPKYETYAISPEEAAKQIKPDPRFEKDWEKEWNSYFPDQLIRKPPPNPIEAGYWPIEAPDGSLAVGGAGERGKAYQEFKKMDSADIEPHKVKVEDNSLKGQYDRAMQDYLDYESAPYTEDIRYYTDENWP